MTQLDFYFDYIDPASFVMERRIREVADALGLTLRLRPWEIRPPGEAPIPPDDLSWVAWWDAMAPAAAESGLQLQRPLRVPFTRKAHELRLHAEAAEAADAAEKAESVPTMARPGGPDGSTSAPSVAARLNDRIFQAALAEGADIGRIDVLVGLAMELGLDRTETRAVLDVDRFSAEVSDSRGSAIEQGVTGAPTLVIGESRMEGVHDAATIREFVTGSMDTEG